MSTIEMPDEAVLLALILLYGGADVSEEAAENPELLDALVRLGWACKIAGEYKITEHGHDTVVAMFVAGQFHAFKQQAYVSH